MNRGALPCMGGPRVRPDRAYSPEYYLFLSFYKLNGAGPFFPGNTTGPFRIKEIRGYPLTLFIPKPDLYKVQVLWRNDIP